MLVRALRFKYRPVAAHVIPVRRCNLACAYCNEFDDHSPAVATAELMRRIDRLAALGTGILTFSGGEPLLHPDLDELIRHVRRRGMIATVITNGYLLNRDRIRHLNDAGLDHLQISIDNVIPDEVSNKSLELLDQKLRWLAADAAFEVTVNSVVGGGIRHPEDAVTIARRARELGLSTTVGLIHDGHGALGPLDAAQRGILAELVSLGRSIFDYANYNRFQKNLADGQPNEWHCRAGSRYLYVCEDGLVHWCSQQRGHPGIPLEAFGPDDLERQYHTVKSCAPFCTVGCVHRVAQVDDLRADPEGTLRAWFSSPAVSEGDGPAGRPPPRLPLVLRVLLWGLVTSRHSNLVRQAIVRAFGDSR